MALTSGEMVALRSPSSSWSMYVCARIAEFLAYGECVASMSRDEEEVQSCWRLSEAVNICATRTG